MKLTDSQAFITFLVVAVLAGLTALEYSWLVVPLAGAILASVTEKSS